MCLPISTTTPKPPAANAARPQTILRMLSSIRNRQPAHTRRAQGAHIGGAVRDMFDKQVIHHKWRRGCEHRCGPTGHREIGMCYCKNIRAWVCVCVLSHVWAWVLFLCVACMYWHNNVTDNQAALVNVLVRRKYMFYDIDTDIENIYLKNLR